MAATQDALDESSMILSFLNAAPAGVAHYYDVGIHMYNMSGKLVHWMAPGVARRLKDGRP
jgi:hypothetical protein